MDPRSRESYGVARGIRSSIFGVHRPGGCVNTRPATRLSWWCQSRAELAPHRKQGAAGRGGAKVRACSEQAAMLAKYRESPESDVCSSWRITRSAGTPSPDFDAPGESGDRSKCYAQS